MIFVGEFMYRFHEVGTYYYSTGPIGKSKNVKLSGAIKVEDEEDRAYKVVVSVGDIKAVYHSGTCLYLLVNEIRLVGK